jgi:hypothetical protein
VTLLKIWELRERIMYRVAPSLAAEYRAKRCLLLRGLKRQEEEAKRDYERWYVYPTPRLLPGSSAAEAASAMVEEIRRLQSRYYGLSTAVVNRQHAVCSGLEPITDLVEASRLLAEVLDAVDTLDGTDRVLHLVWWV